MKKVGIGVLLVGIFLVSANPALGIERWHFNEGGGYGIYSLSLEKINKIHQEIETWTKDKGIEGFEIKKIKNTPSLFSYGRRLETAKK